ncbi:MAG: Shedu immune nuclease family protein [Bacillota bacterium]
MSRGYTVASTSWSSAEVQEPIVLLQQKTTRLLFAPQLVDNVNDSSACVRGYLCWERKGKNDAWEPWQEGNLLTLKKGEGIKIELRAEAVKVLYTGLTELYSLYDSHGIQPGTHQFLKADGPLAAVANLSGTQLDVLAKADSKLGTAALIKLVEWAAGLPSSSVAIDQLASVSHNNLQHLTALAGIAKLQSAINTWQANEHNAVEEFWQQLLIEHQFIMESLFAFPIAIVAEKAYVGGKKLDNKGANLVDYLLKNELTGNAIILEIKTPRTHLLGSEYRDGLHNPSKELTGAVLQALDYRMSFTQTSLLFKGQGSDVEAAEPPCFVIAGHTAQLDTPAKKKSFELFRRQFGGVQVVAFDELFARADKQLKILLQA